MSTLKITIARPVIHVKPNRRRKSDLQATNLKTAQLATTIRLQVKDKRLLTYWGRVATLISLYADANPSLPILKLFITSKLWLSLVTCIDNLSNLLSFLGQRTPYPFLSMTLSCFLYCASLITIPKITLMASLSICVATLHAYQVLDLMDHLADIVNGFLFDLEACLSEKYLALLSFIENSIDVTLTSLERQIQLSPTPLKICINQQPKNEPSQKPEEIVPSTTTPPIKILLGDKCKATAKSESVRENHRHDFDTEGWLLVANPGTCHLALKL